jgi:hypothetical protein
MQKNDAPCRRISAAADGDPSMGSARAKSLDAAHISLAFLGNFVPLGRSSHPTALVRSARADRRGLCYQVRRVLVAQLDRAADF